MQLRHQSAHVNSMQRNLAGISTDAWVAWLQVRIAAAQQLPALAHVLGAAAAVSQVLPELKELLEDDEVQVRHSALRLADAEILQEQQCAICMA
jgi:hypothetical protein